MFKKILFKVGYDTINIFFLEAKAAIEHEQGQRWLDSPLEEIKSFFYKTRRLV